MSQAKAGAIRILIADDHPVVREGVAAMIERRPDMTVVAEAATGRRNRIESVLVSRLADDPSDAEG